MGPDQVSVMNANFMRIPFSTQSAVELLIKHGPCFEVGIQALDASMQHPVSDRFENIVALIDTGATHSCISDRLANRFMVDAVDRTHQAAAGFEPVFVDSWTCKIFFPYDRIILTNKFALLAHLAEPHDIVIGRDILRDTILNINFLTGHWDLTFEIP